MTLYLGENLISGTQVVTDKSERIGQVIVSTIPLTDAGLHLLDGSLISGSGSYSAFVDYIASIYDANANYFTTEASWQTSVSTYGVCGKFVYDSTNNTVRLPKVTGFIEGTIDANALGNLVEAGLPNITGNTTLRSDTRDANGAFYVSSAVGSNYADTGSNPESLFGYAFDASNSNSIYGNSTTVQPQSVKVLCYIVIATSAKTDIQVDIDEIATDLNGKADIDLTNTAAKLSDSFLSKLTPDWSNGEAKANNTLYTASSTGYVYVYGFTQSAQIAITINGTTYQIGGRNDIYGGGASCFILVNKNDTYQTTGNVSSLIFIPLKGAN